MFEGESTAAQTATFWLWAPNRFVQPFSCCDRVTLNSELLQTEYFKRTRILTASIA